MGSECGVLFDVGCAGSRTPLPYLHEDPEKKEDFYDRAGWVGVLLIRPRRVDSTSLMQRNVVAAPQTLAWLIAAAVCGRRNKASKKQHQTLPVVSM